ncbi:F-box domain containing protein [Tanacetum coccineum]
MLEPNQGSTNVLEVKKDPLLEFTCKKSSEKSLGASVRGSCNGLVYLSDGISLVMIHPIRKECYEFPCMNLGFSPRVESLGLGFDASTNTFKMVCVLRKDDKNPCTMVHVLGTNTWREIPQVVPSCPIADKCVYANGCLYWFAKSKATNEVRKVVYFDVKNEEFGSINPPNKIGGGWIDDTQLVDLNGEVGYICNYIINNGIDVWVLKQKEWTRLFRFDQGLCSFGVTKVLGRLNKDEYILVETTTCRGDRLIVLNVNNGVDLYDVKIPGHEDAHKEYVSGRHVIDDLIEFSGETSVDGYMSFFKSQQISESGGFINQIRKEANTAGNLVGQLNALIAEMEALEDQGELFDTLIDLSDDMEGANTKLQGLNALIAQAKQEIETKEAQVQAMNRCMDILLCFVYVVGYLGIVIYASLGDEIYHGDQLLRKRNAQMLVQMIRVCVLLALSVKISEFIFCVMGQSVAISLAALMDIVEGSLIQPLRVGPAASRDKMKLWFTWAHTEEQSFSMGIRAFCFKLRASLNQHRRLIAELQALGQRGDALRVLEGMREIVARDVVKLRVLE